MIVKIVITVFILLELWNVLAMYFAPSSKFGNAIGVFTVWEKSKQYPEIHDFIKYLVNWVAGTKLIFLLLLVVIVLFADIGVQRLSLLALALATSTFYWRLFPLIRKMDRMGQVKPRNYSVVLSVMILVFIAFFLIAALI